MLSNRALTQVDSMPAALGALTLTRSTWQTPVLHLTSPLHLHPHLAVVRHATVGASTQPHALGPALSHELGRWVPTQLLQANGRECRGRLSFGMGGPASGVMMEYEERAHC